MTICKISVLSLLPGRRLLITVFPLLVDHLETETAVIRYYVASLSIL